MGQLAWPTQFSDHIFTWVMGVETSRMADWCYLWLQAKVRVCEPGLWPKLCCKASLRWHMWLAALYKCRTCLTFLSLLNLATLPSRPPARLTVQWRAVFKTTADYYEWTLTAVMFCWAETVGAFSPRRVEGKSAIVTGEGAARVCWSQECTSVWLDRWACRVTCSACE